MDSYVTRFVPPGRSTQQQRHEERVAQMNSTVREIKACYEAGAPLFRKGEMRKLGDVIALLEKGASSECNILLKGINGVDYPLELKHLRGDDFPGRDRHIGGSIWNIGYNPIQHLTVFEDIDFFHPSSAFFSMDVTGCIRTLEDSTPTALLAPSTEELLGAYEQRVHQFKESKDNEVLRAALQKMRTRHVLDKFVAVALGPLNLGGQNCDRSLDQHVLVNAIASALISFNIQCSRDAKIHFQDPAYTQLDRDVLTSYGYTVVDDPQGFLMLDDNSILVSISPDVPVKQIVVDICRPAIIIWNKENFKDEYTDYSSDYYMTDPSSSRVDKMLKEEYHELEFPFHKSYSGLAMYVKNSIWID
ncbi:hypothetical protein F4678DRAFT_477607 [Xylaria arbuscula]|nr:hypothetical protein F4678DRAFT_477607 [Xylaria arbuscula]